MRFMLASGATLQIHFIDIVAIPALESVACCFTAKVERERYLRPAFACTALTSTPAHRLDA
jgi:hypothetical protein